MSRHVFVTGATGFIGAHVVDELLSRGIRVKFAARSDEKAKKFLEDRKDKAELLSYAIIKDFSNGESVEFDEAISGTDGVIHVASPFTYNVTDVERELILPAIAGVKAIMKAAASHKDIKRLVLTSSFASVVNASRGPGPGFTYTSEDWNPITYEEAVKADPGNAYRGSKKYAELEAWKFVKDNADKISFDLVTLCPPMVFGPIAHPLNNVSELNTSNAALWSIVQGEVPPTRVPVWIDVRDLAKAHVEALLRPEAGGQRYVASSKEFFSYQRAADIITETFPWGKKYVPQEHAGEPIPASYELDSSKLTKDLGIEFTPFKKTVIDSITQFAKLPGSVVKE